ncbi:hypothetical protein Q9L58_010290 [Maublancomyces gigas]|uniref:Uncharacterized protein n=1 Tax=Discina gigas TaxID=1032678 RepID=A0ABR3G4K7_9PEZI
MVSFLDQCWVDTDYPDFATTVSLLDDIQVLNWMEGPTSGAMIDAEALVMGTGPQSQGIFDTGATDHMSGIQVTSAVRSKATVTVAGGRQLQVTGIGNATLKLSQEAIQITKVLRVPDPGHSGFLPWQKLASMGYYMKREGTEIEILKNEVVELWQPSTPPETSACLGKFPERHFMCQPKISRSRTIT